MNDLNLRWKDHHGPAKSKNTSSDRAPTFEEIKKLLEYRIEGSR